MVSTLQREDFTEVIFMYEWVVLRMALRLKFSQLLTEFQWYVASYSDALRLLYFSIPILH